MKCEGRILVRVRLGGGDKPYQAFLYTVRLFLQGSVTQKWKSFSFEPNFSVFCRSKTTHFEVVGGCFKS